MKITIHTIPFLAGRGEKPPSCPSSSCYLHFLKMRIKMVQTKMGVLSRLTQERATRETRKQQQNQESNNAHAHTEQPNDAGFLAQNPELCVYDTPSHPTPVLWRPLSTSLAPWQWVRRMRLRKSQLPPPRPSPTSQDSVESPQAGGGGQWRGRGGGTSQYRVMGLLSRGLVPGPLPWGLAQRRG